MRKKSKKKQIVAMTLALSVLSSSVGMCGASAAEALPDTDDSGLRVTVVPLADSNADTDTPADDTKTEKQPVASTGDNTDQPTDGEGDGDNTSSDDKPTIERPEQSDTVETLPGTAEDNKDHIKGEDKDDTEDKGETGEDKDDTEDKGDSGEETPDTATRRKRARKVPALRRPRRKSPKRPPKRMTPTAAVPMTRTPVTSRSPSTSRKMPRATRPLS